MGLKCLAIRVGRSCNADQLIDVLVGLMAERGAPVNGHGDLPTGGQRSSPRTATRSPRGRPASLLRDGHGNSPRTATFLPGR